MTIGENIRKIRKARGMKLIDLAKRTGYSYQHLCRLEHDKQTANLTTAIDIADVLEVSLDELVGRDFKKALKPVEKFPFDYCPRCSRGVHEGLNYCGGCGQALDWSDTE